MRKALNKSSSSLKRHIVSQGKLIVAGILFAGVIMMGYGYFQQNKIGLYAGIGVIVAGVLNGVVQILVHGKR